ncbi:hypothetical protein F5878DRAFT_552474 [Lentinula raphanica]|uniref:PIN domain-like protein n=1 Tax=Lentinula raphanica TaxID=153919 RepID=A0AA38PJZ5_9AGAR|nr:hypothetical protein F5880DRAFT_282791 [Lentinula raphanica]KAJ3844357.1 hypothetical protein F5878DRAFT_552474 [Lentinula raphanica]
MGVHGLTTYLREHRELSRTVLLPLNEPKPVHFVIDGWSFIYELIFSLPWVYGGEYPQLARLITTVVQAWLNVGVRLSFVFDGPSPEIKFHTLRSRMTKSHIEPSLLFFRTSQVSRSTPRFLNESRIIPPLSYPVTIHTLLQLQSAHPEHIDIHFADEEGDPFAVELAGRLGAYVVANDSDFVILNTEGYRGFIPLQSMSWHSPRDEEQKQDEADEWVTAGKRKRPAKNANLRWGIIPPDDTSSEITLSFTVHSPEALSSFLNIPITLLPLLGALAGNDFSNQSAGAGKQVQQLFFESRMPPSARIDRVATTLRSILSLAQKNTRKQAKYHVDSVMDLISKTVKALLIRSLDSLGSGEVEGIVERVVEATLQYAIPKNESPSESDNQLWPSSLCALHPPELCPMLPIFSRNIAANEWSEAGDQEVAFVTSEKFNKLDAVRRILLEAYRAGKLSPTLLNALNSASLWTRLFLENPDVETSAKITRPLRIWCCAILDDAVGLPETIDEESDQVTDDSQVVSDEDEDELVDVVESDSEDEGPDMLAPLKGALRRLHEPNSDTSSSPSSTDDTLPIGSFKQSRITEYHRRGVRLVDEVVLIPPLAELLSESSAWSSSYTSPRDDYHPKHGVNTPSRSLLTRSLDERLSVLYHALRESPITSPKMNILTSEKLLTVLALRWLLRYLHDQAEKDPHSKEKQQARWTEKEAKCFLAAFDWNAGECASSEEVYQGFPPILDRNVQLTSQILQCLEGIHLLAEVLLVGESVSSSAHLFSGRQFHAYLTGELKMVSVTAPGDLWVACVDGLGGVFGEERMSRKEKKAKKKPQKPDTVVNDSSEKHKGNSHRNNTKISNGGAGFYDLLGDVEA